MAVPRTLKEEVAAKRNKRREAQQRLAERASDDFNIRIEEQRRSKVDQARSDRLLTYDERVKEIDQELAVPGLEPEVRRYLENARDEVLEVRARVDRSWRP